MPVQHRCAVLACQSDGQLRSWLLNTPVRFAGHAHWQNIKKTKTEKDDQRQKLINQTVQRIRSAIRGMWSICLVNIIIHVFWHSYKP